MHTSHTAVLAMDCQAGIVSVYAKPQEEFIKRASNVLAAARQAAITVIHIQVGFRPGLPEVGRRNKLFAAIKESAPRVRFAFLVWRACRRIRSTYSCMLSHSTPA
jgi:nicotinamidase-related amidase